MNVNVKRNNAKKNNLTGEKMLLNKLNDSEIKRLKNGEVIEIGQNQFGKIYARIAEDMEYTYTPVDKEGAILSVDSYDYKTKTRFVNEIRKVDFDNKDYYKTRWTCGMIVKGLGHGVILNEFMSDKYKNMEEVNGSN